MATTPLTPVGTVQIPPPFPPQATTVPSRLTAMVPPPPANAPKRAPQPFSGLTTSEPKAVTFPTCPAIKLPESAFIDVTTSATPKQVTRPRLLACAQTSDSIVSKAPRALFKNDFFMGFGSF